MSCKYFENRDCEFYPCHHTEKMNCLFCFCPLYNTDCGGNYKMLEGEDGTKIKDCSDCLIPHSENGYDYIIEKLKNAQANENTEPKRGV